MKVRRGWIKVLISVDDQNKQVVGIEVTKADRAVGIECRRRGGKEVQANGDGAYDSNDNLKLNNPLHNPTCSI
ncbi:MAG: hypothetical protein ACXQTS_00665, partial [Candidatus Methanospirareceae archaeon]